jgi:hypothetical protein
MLLRPPPAMCRAQQPHAPHALVVHARHRRHLRRYSPPLPAQRRDAGGRRQASGAGEPGLQEKEWCARSESAAIRLFFAQRPWSWVIGGGLSIWSRRAGDPCGGGRRTRGAAGSPRTTAAVRSSDWPRWRTGWRGLELGGGSSVGSRGEELCLSLGASGSLRWPDLSASPAVLLLRRPLHSRRWIYRASPLFL